MATYTITKKITTTKTTEEAIEVELPYYSRSLCYAYKVVDKESAVDVCIDDTNFGIIRSSSSHAFNDNCTQITEEEFNQLFTETLNKLKFLNS